MVRDQQDIDEIEIEEHHGSSEMKWTPLIVTHVEHVKGDWIGIFFALSSLGPMTLIISFITLILFRRDLHTMAFFAGLLIMEPLNFLLKLKIRESRPLQRVNQLGDYGMPSSHSQHLWFFATYSILFILIRLDHSSLESCGLIAALLASAALVAYGRVYLQYHTWTQIVLGGLLGTITGALWFTFVHLVLTPLVFPTIVSWKISEFLLIRDTSNIPHLMNFEYKNAVQANQQFSSGGDESLLQTSTSCFNNL